MNKHLKRNIKYFLRFIPDKTYLKLYYFAVFKKKLNLANPCTFNEKLQWLKLYDKKDIYITMVDKYEVKKYVSDIIGEEFIIPTIGIYDSFDEIDFDKLPNQFVLKCTHDSDGIIIVNDKAKFNIKESKKLINKCLKRNYFYSGREWPYKKVKPRIIIEKYMGDNLADYKFFTFNADVKCVLLCTDRKKNLKETFLDTNWEIMPFKRPNHDIEEKAQKPKQLKNMIKFAKKLSKNIPFLRVDFYEIDGKIYFGELTFFPASGLNKFEPKEWDSKLGEWIQLPRED